MMNAICIGGPLAGERHNSKHPILQGYKMGTRIDVFEDEVNISPLAKIVSYHFVEIRNAENIWMLEKDYKEFQKARNQEAFLHNLLVKAYRIKC